MQKTIYVCSPLRGDIEKNLQAAAQYCKEVVQVGLTPYCPHLFYSSFLNDTVPAERTNGVEMGLAFIRERMLPDFDELWVFGSRVSEGMAGEIREARKTGVLVVNHGPLFSLPAGWDKSAFYRIRFYDRHGAFEDRKTALFSVQKPIFTDRHYPRYANLATFHVLDNERLAGWSLFVCLPDQKWTESLDSQGCTVGFDSGRRS